MCLDACVPPPPGCTNEGVVFEMCLDACVPPPPGCTNEGVVFEMCLDACVSRKGPANLLSVCICDCMRMKVM
jgi:hypothetical protein